MKSGVKWMAIGRTFKEALFKGLRSLEAVKPLRLETCLTTNCSENWPRPNLSAFPTLLTLTTWVADRGKLQALTELIRGF